jgi:hypothetical protein
LAANPIPQPPSTKAGQKKPAPLIAQIPIRKALTST